MEHSTPRPVHDITADDLDCVVRAVQRRARGRAPADVEDAVASALLRAVRFRPAAENWRAWLTVAALRLLYTHAHLSHERRAVAIDAVPPAIAGRWCDHAPDPTDALERDAQITALRTQLDTLPPLQRDALLLFTLHELSFPEIAQRLQSTVTACRMAASRARAALRTRLCGDPLFDLEF